MELKWLLDFESLASTGNFSRSAEDRNITQSAFSRRIQALESWLGVELVDRTTHPTSLTDSGIRFLTTARYMIQLADNIQEDFRGRPSRQRDVITFSSSTNLAITFLPDWFAKMSQGFDDVDITVQTDISGIHDHFKILRTNQSDFLLHYGQSEMLTPDASKFDHIVLDRDVLIPVCSRDFDGEATLTPADDKTAIPYLSPWRTSSIANAIAAKIARSNPYSQMDTRLESSIVGCTKGFVAQGAGIAWLPQSIIESELASGAFVEVADASYHVPLTIQLYRYSAATKPIARKFWEYVLTKYE